MLSDLIGKEKGKRNAENTSENESNNEETSLDIENQEREDVASENGAEAEDTQESDDTENDSQETESSSPETSTTFHSESPCEHCERNANEYGTLIMKCPQCFWHDYYKICPICHHQSPGERNYIKGGFLRCHYSGAITHKNAKTLETKFYSPSKEENEEED